MSLQKAQVEKQSPEEALVAQDVTDIKTALGLNDTANIVVVDTATYTPQNNDVLHTVVTTTITDPTPVEGKGYVVKVVNGTSTIGGVNYVEGNIITRFFHSGSWRSKLYNVVEVTPENKNVGVASENLSVTGTFNVDVSANDSMRLNLTGNTTLALINTPASGETKVVNLAITTDNGTETLTLPASWNVYGTFDASVRNKITLDISNFTSGLEVDCFINQPS